MSKVISVILVCLLFPSFHVTSAKSTWKSVGSYVVFEQFFSWNGHNTTRYMMWIITDLSGDIADFYVVSHSFNVTDGEVNIYLTESKCRVNTETREITEVFLGPNITGYKNPFWIDTNVGIGSQIDAYFGSYATIQQNETIEILGQRKNCWTVSLNWTTANMKRWYDQATGIVLKINVTLIRDGITMGVRETVVLSNIPAISGTPPSPLIDYWQYLLVTAFILVGATAITILYIYKRTKRFNAKETATRALRLF